NCPSPANSEFVKAKHVHHSYSRQCHLEEFGSLRHRCAHEETAIASATNRDLVGVCILIRDQVFSRANEVIEYILFFLKHSCLVPFFSLFASATNIHNYIDAALLNDDRIIHAKARIHCDIESAVSVHQNRSCTIKLHTLLVGDEHRNFCTILAGEEHLLCSDSFQVEIGFGLPEQHRLA